MIILRILIGINFQNAILELDIPYSARKFQKKKKKPFNYSQL